MLVRPITGELDRQRRLVYILNSLIDEVFIFSRPAFELPEKQDFSVQSFVKTAVRVPRNIKYG